MKVIAVFLLGLVALASCSRFAINSEIFDKATCTYNTSILADNEDGKLCVPHIIEKYGYPVETHNVITEDGYNLTIHRIPYSPKCGPAADKRVAFLQHGLLGDSSNWIVAGTEKGLAYNLADECYDVWMGNYRGNTYSRKHITLDPDVDREEFWSFSWNELGLYDVPAFIDYVINATGVDGLYYTGHSMGTTGFWVCMAERPEYNAKIKLHNALAPVAWTEHMRPPLSLIAPFEDNIEWLLKMFGQYEFLPTNSFMEFLGQTVCHQNSTIKDICGNVLFLLAGWDPEQLDPELVPTIVGHSPAGSSVRNLVHYAQGVNSGEFRKYSFGREQNTRIYGSPTPPIYHVERITCPVAFYYGDNDSQGSPPDVYHLAEKLSNLQRIFRVNFDKYNHLDFLWAIDNVELLNKHVIEFMKNF